MIQVADFGVRSWPPEARLVAALNANFDDSQDGDGADIWVIAGYVGYAPQWTHFERLWRAALRRHDVPYFHMTEMNDPRGPFAKWLPHTDHQEEVRSFFVDLADAILKCMLYMVSAVVWLKDVERFNQENGLALEAYPLAAHACIMNMSLQFPGSPITAVFDRADQIQSKLDKARAYSRADKRLVEAFDAIAIFPLQKPLTVRDVPALQAADFIAWELRKEHYKMKEWQLTEREPLTDRPAQWERYIEWSRQKTGSDPILRKSLEALINNNSRIRGFVWDYQQLNDAKQAKGGILLPSERGAV